MNVIRILDEILVDILEDIILTIMRPTAEYGSKERFRF